MAGRSEPSSYLVQAATGVMIKLQTDRLVDSRQIRRSGAAPIDWVYPNEKT